MRPCFTFEAVSCQKLCWDPSKKMSFTIRSRPMTPKLLGNRSFRSRSDHLATVVQLPDKSLQDFLADGLQLEGCQKPTKHTFKLVLRLLLRLLLLLLLLLLPLLPLPLSHDRGERRTSGHHDTERVRPWPEDHTRSIELSGLQEDVEVQRTFTDAFLPEIGSKVSSGWQRSGVQSWADLPASAHVS